MQINLDEILEPWNLTFTIRGKEYQTRPMELKDLAKIVAVDKKDAQGNLAIVKSFFVGEAPDLEGDADCTAAIVSAIYKYFELRKSKNAEAVARALKGLATANSTSGSPSIA